MARHGHVAGGEGQHHERHEYKGRRHARAVAEQVALRHVDLSKQRCQPLVVVNPVRPVVLLPDVTLFFAFHAVIVVDFRRTVNSITAFFAAY